MAPTAIFAILAAALAAGVNAGAPRITINHWVATFGEFPYQVSLRSSGEHHCSGAIISSRHILTTAYCVVGVTNLTVVTGTIYSNVSGESHKPKNIVYHRLYDLTSATSDFDIAVITLDEDIIFDADQNEIPLQTAPTPVGNLAIATGWGFTRTSPLKVAPTLSKVYLSIISYKQCREMFSPTIPIYMDQICTSARPGSCAADSGTPLVYNGQLIGLFSYGIPCNLGAPDVFTNIYHLRDWINATINPEEQARAPE